jgi:CIC family chloride channel protein
MGTVFAGIIRAPMTSVLMIFETTRDYSVIVPLMISNLVSFFISSRLQKFSIYGALSFQDGIHLPSSEHRQQHGQHLVKSAMEPVSFTLPASLSVSEAMVQASASESQAWPVLDPSGVIGVVDRSRLEGALRDGPPTRLLLDLADPTTFPHVHLDHSLDWALERMGAAQLDILPVVGRGNVHELLGVITLTKVLDAYGVTRTEFPKKAWDRMGME